MAATGYVWLEDRVDVWVITEPGNPGWGRSTLDSGGSTFAGSGGPTQAADTAAGSGTFTVPTFSGSGAPSQAAQTSTGVANFDPPSFTGSGAVTQAANTATGAANFDAPTFSGSGTPTQANQTAAGVGNFDIPEYAGTGSPVQGADTATAAGTATPPVFFADVGPFAQYLLLRRGDLLFVSPRHGGINLVGFNSGESWRVLSDRFRVSRTVTRAQLEEVLATVWPANSGLSDEDLRALLAASLDGVGVRRYDGTTLS